MASPEYIEARLVALTNAVTASHDAKNNRFHYLLHFSDDIGFDWLETQVGKAASDAERGLELYKVRPIHPGIAVEVRETERRETNIDDAQHGLEEFEEQ